MLATPYPAQGFGYATEIFTKWDEVTKNFSINSKLHRAYLKKTTYFKIFKFSISFKFLREVLLYNWPLFVKFIYITHIMEIVSSKSLNFFN